MKRSFLLILGLALPLGCNLIASVDRDEIPSADGGKDGGGTGGTGATTGGGTGGVVVGGSAGSDAAAGSAGLAGNAGSGGISGSAGVAGAAGAGGSAGAPECTQPGECGTDTECQKFACDTGNCVTNNEPLNTPCTTGGVLCDGQGACVPATCVDGQLNGDETDIDCGGSCGDCANGDDCGDGDDCQSGFCDPSGGQPTCQPCAAASDCNATGNFFCDAGVCTPKLPDGDSCSAAGECVNGNCTDGVCCDTTCGGGVPGDCQACNVAGSLGTCSTVPTGTSCGSAVDDECDDPDTCDAAGSCQPNPAPSGSACGSPVDDACTDADTCNGNGGCVSNDAASGSPCGDQGVACHNDDTCNATGTCVDNGLVATGNPCGSSADTECTNPDSCTAAGTCAANDAAAGSACGDQGVDCNTDDACDGAGACTDNGFETAGSPCGSPLDTECTNPDSCNATGACQPNHAGSGSPCGDQGVACHVDDACSGSGTCTDNGFSTPGTACGSPSDTACTNPDTCIVGGVCSPNDEVSGTVCDDGLFCNGADACNATGACNGGSTSPCGVTQTCLEPTDSCQLNAFINELHYDNIGTDAGEFVEVAVPASASIALLTVTLYNGNGGATYATHALSTFTVGATTNGLTFYSKLIPGLQNGAPDGLSLDDNGSVLQFLCYEGPFTATAGVANGLTCVDVGVTEEDATTPLGASLGLTGTGNEAADFTWTVNADDTPGDVNNGQTIN